MKITDAEKEMISKLNHPLYTAEFLEHWVNRNDNPMINAPAALQAMGAKGYLEAVRLIVDKQIDVARQVLKEMKTDLVAARGTIKHNGTVDDVRAKLSCYDDILGYIKHFEQEHLPKISGENNTENKLESNRKTTE